LKLQKCDLFAKEEKVQGKSQSNSTMGIEEIARPS
jgi:hypothetical protein